MVHTPLSRLITHFCPHTVSLFFSSANFSLLHSFTRLFLTSTLLHSFIMKIRVSPSPLMTSFSHTGAQMSHSLPVLFPLSHVFLFNLYFIVRSTCLLSASSSLNPFHFSNHFFLFLPPYPFRHFCPLCCSPSFSLSLKPHLISLISFFFFYILLSFIPLYRFFSVTPQQTHIWFMKICLVQNSL